MDKALERQRIADLRNVQDAALLGGFDHIGPHAIKVDARNLRMPGDHRLQKRGPHLHRLLHHVIEASMLEWCKQKVQIASRRLRAKLRIGRGRQGPPLRR